MRRVGSFLLGWVVSLGGTIGAQAADAPGGFTAPITYVRVCDAFGAGFFTIPGTNTCLKIGGLALGETRIYNNTYRVANEALWGNGVATGSLPLAKFQPAAQRNSVGIVAYGRLELDARSATSWGTLRTFVRADTQIGGGAASFGSTLAGVTASRQYVIVSKAFLQFAGLTAGRAQSMFDFYADAYNFETLRGSNATVELLAYTATFGKGFSATLSVEDPYSRRGAIGSVIAGDQAVYANTRSPDFVANLRSDQAWGALQLSAAAHDVTSSLFAMNPASGAQSGFPLATSNSFGFAVQGGASFNLPTLAPGDKLWLQAAYEKGAVGYIAGNNLAFTGSPVSGNINYASNSGQGLGYGTGWQSQYAQDCTWTGASIISARCEKQWGVAFTAALKHYWAPNWSSALFASYMTQHYSNNAVNSLGGAIGVTNLKEVRTGTNLTWTPLPGFDLGAEFVYEHVNEGRPANIAPDSALSGSGLPAFTTNQNVYEGRLRVQRAF